MGRIMSIWPPPPTNRSDDAKIRQVKAELENYDLAYATVPSFTVRGNMAVLTIRTPEEGWNCRTWREIFSEAFRPKKEKTFTEFDVCLSFTGVQSSQEPTLQRATSSGLLDRATGEWIQRAVEELDEFEIVTSGPRNCVQLCINNTELEFGFTDCTLCIVGSRQDSIP